MRCSKCGKEVIAFYPDTAMCRLCKNAMDRDLYRRNKEKYKEDKGLPDVFKLGKILCF